LINNYYKGIFIIQKKNLHKKKKGGESKFPAERRER
jgi:hypothetical protein